MNMNNSFDINTKDLLREVNRLVHVGGLDYIEATIHYCESQGYDIESLADVIPSSLRSNIESTARAKKLLKPQFNNINVLPL